MIADIMTKPLAEVKFTHFRKAMKVLPVVTSAYVY
ncbi:hypothetical protein PI124_g22173 [Phytophthora idaei]|nr:hypothetical protein PI125_g23780 [Phytophthora idaei]KAG3127126.1 hypothetical protein PI126_g22004 [Phytophthora idaei]KAG3232748.1 hypothetical protein PI124_g22173 [Phytophthora idaei]